MQEKKQKQKPHTTKLGISQKVKAKSFKIHATVGITQKKVKIEKTYHIYLRYQLRREEQAFFHKGKVR